MQLFTFTRGCSDRDGWDHADVISQEEERILGVGLQVDEGVLLHVGPQRQSCSIVCDQQGH